MNWRYYESWVTGNTCVIEGKYSYTCPFEIGQIATGKQRVFYGFFVRIHLHDGKLVAGEDRHTLRDALFDLNRLLEDRGMLLLAAGLEPRFSESCLSFNTGFGYLSDCDFAVHMMDIPPPRDRNPEADLFVEGLIREAVDGMSFGRGTTR
ncbi:MAG: hypothetical protein U1E37_05910 [Sphingomonadaceae bacterium]